MIQTKNLAMVFVAVMVGTVGGAYGFIQDAQIADSQMENASIYGHVEMVLRDEDGNIKDYLQSDNLIVDVGIDTMGDLMFPNIDLNSNATDNEFSYIEIGTGTTAVAATDTTIQTAIPSCAREQDTAVTGDSSVSGEITVTIDASFLGSANCANGAVNEAVLANALTGGEILAHKLFASSINLQAADTLTVTWTITIT